MGSASRWRCRCSMPGCCFIMRSMTERQASLLLDELGIEKFAEIFGAGGASRIAGARYREPSAADSGDEWEWDRVISDWLTVGYDLARSGNRRREHSSLRSRQGAAQVARRQRAHRRWRGTIAAMQRQQEIAEARTAHLKEPKPKQSWQEQYALAQQWVTRR